MRWDDDMGQLCSNAHAVSARMMHEDERDCIMCVPSRVRSSNAHTARARAVACAYERDECPM